MDCDSEEWIIYWTSIILKSFCWISIFLWIIFCLLWSTRTYNWLLSRYLFTIHQCMNDRGSEPHRTNRDTLFWWIHTLISKTLNDEVHDVNLVYRWRKSKENTCNIPSVNKNTCNKPSASHATRLGVSHAIRLSVFHATM